jgi:hypothetical protein
VNRAEAWSPYEAYTEGVTNFARKLGFAGFALAWVLRKEEFAFSGFTLLALGFLITYVLLDVLQYVVAAWKSRMWLLEVESESWDALSLLPDSYPPRPGELDIWPWRMWNTKVLSLSLAYLALAGEILSRGIG